MRVPLAVRALPSVAERVWFTPPRPRPETLERDADALASVEPIWVMVEERERPGFSVGEGPLVILVHGWGGRAAQMTELAEALAGQGLRAVAIDAPGHGTDAQTTSDGFQLAAAVRAVTDVYGQPAAVVAHSIGAIATVLAFSDDPPPTIVFLAPVLDAEQALSLFSKRAQLFPWTSRSLARRFRRFAGELWPVITAGHDTGLDGSHLLILHDPDDPDTEFSISATLAAKRANTRLEVTDGLGHKRLLRDPGAIDTVTRFVLARTAESRPASR